MRCLETESSGLRSSLASIRLWQESGVHRAVPYEGIESSAQTCAVVTRLSLLHSGHSSSVDSPRHTDFRTLIFLSICVFKTVFVTGSGASLLFLLYFSFMVIFLLVYRDLGFVMEFSNSFYSVVSLPQLPQPHFLPLPLFLPISPCSLTQV